MSEFDDVARAFEHADEAVSAEVETLSPENPADDAVPIARLRVIQPRKGPHATSDRLSSISRSRGGLPASAAAREGLVA